jgi:MoaA/NifB/PqqE/SkfB family radical SAM enzyme
MVLENVINVRYVTDYPKCNFACKYCIAGHGEVTKGRERFWDAGRYKAIVDNLTKVDAKLNVRLGVAGEFFLDKKLIAGAKLLSNSDNVESVNLISNLSFKYKQYMKLMSGFNLAKTAMVASYHPQEVKDHDLWLETAVKISESMDFAIVMVAFPEILEDLPRYAAIFESAGLEVFVQPFIGNWQGVLYPGGYTEEQEAMIKGLMYSRHDYEFLLKLKKPGLCNAGHKSLYISPLGKVFPCGMGSYPKPIGDLSESPEIEFSDGPKPCPFSKCQCDTENMNTVQFENYYDRDSLNQHRYNYKFEQDAAEQPSLSEWNVAY